MKNIIKKLQPSKDVFIQFDEEEIAYMGIKPGDKFTATHREDGSIELKKFVPVEIELGDFSREDLELIIKQSIEKDIPVSDIIIDSLKNSLDLEG